jgi:molecular chaperone DnaK
MELRQALESNDVGEIRAKTQALEQAAQPLAQAVYAQANQQAASASSGEPTGDGGETDEVVEDADYEVIDEDEAAKTS